MSVAISSFTSVPERAAELKCVLPVSLVFLPANFEEAGILDEFRFNGEVSTVTKVLKSAGIPIARLATPEREQAFVHNRSHDWVLPLIFISAELLKQNPDMISAALDAVKDYVSDFFKGVTGKRNIKAELVIEDRREKKYKKFTYEGSPEGLKELSKSIKSLNRKN